MSKKFTTRIQHKRATEAEWLKAKNFTPLEGELIIYETDAAHKTPRFKIGDGSTKVNDLSFFNAANLATMGKDSFSAGAGVRLSGQTFEVDVIGTIGPIDLSTLSIYSNVNAGATSIQIKSTSLITKELFDKLQEAEYNGIIVQIGNEIVPIKNYDNFERVSIIPLAYKATLYLMDGFTIQSAISAGTAITEVYMGGAVGEYSFASNNKSLALGDESHAEGSLTTTTKEGIAAHAEGYLSIADGLAAHAEGTRTTASAGNAHAEGYRTIASGGASHAEGSQTKATSDNAHAEGNVTEATAASAHAEGYNTKATAAAAHAEGTSSTASANYSHAEGYSTTAGGNAAHAEGWTSQAQNPYSHAEGLNTTASGDASHAEGSNTVASGTASHAEGVRTQAIGAASHAQGAGSVATGVHSSAFGNTSKAGYGNQFIVGAFNDNKANTVFEVGNGSKEDELDENGNVITKNRSNAFEVYHDGRAELKKQGTTDNSVVIKSGLKTINGESIVGEGNIELAADVNLDNYYTKEDIDNIAETLNVKTVKSSNIVALDNADHISISAINNSNNTVVANVYDNIVLNHNIVCCSGDFGNTCVISWNSEEYYLNGTESIVVTPIDNTTTVGFYYSGAMHYSVDVVNVNLKAGVSYRIYGYETQGNLQYEVGEYGATQPMYDYYMNIVIVEDRPVKSFELNNGVNKVELQGIKNNTLAILPENTTEIVFTAKYIEKPVYKTINGESILGEGNIEVSVNLDSLNIKNSIGASSLQQNQDTKYTGIAIVDKNPTAAAHDSSLTNNEPIGAKGDFATSLGGASSAQGKRSVAEGTNTIAKGAYSHAEGDNSVTLGNDSHAEGYTTYAGGTASHAEGGETAAIGGRSHAEGSGSTAAGDNSHAEGYKTNAVGMHSHTEGYSTRAEGVSAHAEGINTIAEYDGAHSEGSETAARGEYSHAEGSGTIASGIASHAEGDHSTASGYFSHAGGEHSQAKGTSSFAHGTGVKAEGEFSAAFGNSTIARGDNQFVIGKFNIPKDDNTLFIIGNGGEEHSGYNNSNAFEVYKDGHAELQAVGTTDNSILTLGSAVGRKNTNGGEIFNRYDGANTATGINSHAEGNITTASGSQAHAEGYNTTASANQAHAEGQGTVASGDSSHTEGYSSEASGIAAHAEGNGKALNNYAHAEGYNTKSTAIWAHSEGGNTQALGDGAHAEGAGSIANAYASHAEGQAKAYAMVSHAEGNSSTGVDGDNETATYAHAEGKSTQATGSAAHSEGSGTIASGKYSHAEGAYTQALQYGTHAAGYYTIANYNYQTVVGKFNDNKEDTLFEVGNGTDATYDNEGNLLTNEVKSNAFEVYKDGHAEIQTMGETDKSIATKAYVDSQLSLQIHNTLPEASQDMRGKIIIVPEDNTDKIYICLSIKGVYTWVSFDDTNISEETTSILGQATLGSLILGKE